MLDSDVRGSTMDLTELQAGVRYGTSVPCLMESFHGPIRTRQSVSLAVRVRMLLGMCGTDVYDKPYVPAHRTLRPARGPRKVDVASSTGPYCPSA